MNTTQNTIKQEYLNKVTEARVAYSANKTSENLNAYITAMSNYNAIKGLK